MRCYIVVFCNKDRATTLENISRDYMNEDNDYYINSIDRTGTSDGYHLVCIQSGMGMSNDDMLRFVSEELGLDSWDDVVKHGLSDMVPMQLQQITLGDINFGQSTGNSMTL